MLNRLSHPGAPEIIFLNLKNYSFIFERERERDRASEQSRGRERELGSKAGFRLQAVSTDPDARLKFTNHEIMS